MHPCPCPQFGGCLALRVALAAPELVERMVLVNPATCFGRSLGGLSSLIAATNLLSLFPAPLYQARPLRLQPLLHAEDPNLKTYHLVVGTPQRC